MPRLIVLFVIAFVDTVGAAILVLATLPLTATLSRTARPEMERGAGRE